jgi:hypothetical protein
MENAASRSIELRAPGHDAVERTSRKRFAIAFAVAAVSDALSFWTEFAPPVQWTVDLITASLLFLVPGLVAEAIPGLAAFPVWVLVVLSIVVYQK